MSDKKEFIDIRERAFTFAVRIVKLCQFLEKQTGISRNLIRQLLDAGTSVGANLEEGQAGQSKPDFISKNAIALKEARETNYWLRLILATNEFAEKIKIGIEDLRDESLEIANVVGAIIVSAKKDK
jgi:four helix bundle protein